jgi:hypothetical protein
MNAMIASSKNLRISAARFSSAHSNADKPFLYYSILNNGGVGDVCSTFFRVGGGGEVLLTGLTRDGGDGVGEGVGEGDDALLCSAICLYHLVN